MAAVIKCNIRRYIDEKHNVTNSKEFIEAARETKHLSSYCSSTVPDQTKKRKKTEWCGIKSFNNIEYFKSTASTPIQLQGKDKRYQCDDMHVKCWRAWNIGVGKTFMWKSLPEIDSVPTLQIIDDFSITNNQWLMEPKEDESLDLNPIADSQEEDIIEENHQSTDHPTFEIFDCPEEGCTKQFVKHGQLLNHLSTGKHTKHFQKVSLLDTAKSLYQHKLENPSIRQIPSLKEFAMKQSKETQQKKLSSGWALMQKKTNSRLTTEQKKFLENKYDQGEQQNMKFNAVDVAQEMEVLMNGHEYVFEPYEWLKPSQIQSFWSRLTKNRRRSTQKQTTTDIIAVSDDNNDEDEADDEDSFEEIQRDVKQELLKKQEQMSKENAEDSSVISRVSSSSMKIKQSQRSMDDLADLQRKKKFMDK